MKPVFLREADRAMDLMGDRRAHLHRAVGAQFRCGNFEPGIPALKRLCRTDGCAIRGSRLAGESGERLLHGLELAERPAELLPLVDIADRQRERRIERAGDLRRARERHQGEVRFGAFPGRLGNDHSGQVDGQGVVAGEAENGQRVHPVTAETAIGFGHQQRGQAQLFEPGPVTVHRGIRAQFGK